MKRNKPRLEIALYARPKHPDEPHWALFLTPKSKSGESSNSATKYHVKNTLHMNLTGELSQPWRYERLEIADLAQSEPRLLARIVIGKVRCVQALEQVLQNDIPIYQGDDAEHGGSFNCVSWVAAAVAALRRPVGPAASAAVSGLSVWEHVEAQSLGYLRRKMEEGRWRTEWKGPPGVPTWDLLEAREVSP